MDYVALFSDVEEIVETEAATSINSRELSEYHDLVRRRSGLYSLDDLCNLYL